MSRHTNGAGLDPLPSDEQLLESARVVEMAKEGV